MSTRRPNRDGQAFHNAEPDSSLPPPPPYVPVDRTNSSANQSQAQALAQQQAARQQYAPPPGPPPGVTPPAVGQHTGRPLVSSPRNSQSSYDPSAPAAPGRPTNPFADPSSLQGAYPPMQPSQAAPPASSQQQHHASPQQGSYGMPSGPATAGYGGYGGPSAGPSSGAGAAPRRQGSIAEHARKMSADMANLNLASPAEGGGAVRRASTIREDPLELLKDFDTIFVVDDSASMSVNELPDGSMGRSRWEEARDAVSGVVELAAKYDRDGVDVYFLNNDRAIENCTDPREVLRVFDSIEPEGATPTGMRLEILLLDYLDRIEEYKERLSRGQNPGPEPKKRNYIVITDGSPTDDPEDVIVACARRLDRANMPLSQIGIQFLQVGDDAEATEALQDLDDALSKEHGIRDMVDTVTYSSMALNADLIIKALLGGINRRLDRKKERRA
ncbi:uncharacterized protein PFL1_04752 [Pseudozyma flocculosa PF-1]|uniref:VWFA domain-containing protein n=1 Tax=Pseudozyma flocculosa PF-1 TaxID=1277687 RepID=A0A061H595_9BASI|nr:uncharacterized protein PFL1_04752 [Pseudozyma flocculosa PF-1]EPQ27614.1 hypothetical protein PFL1_04752 [Pseudozyma flocculosa PF-1]